MPRGCFLVETFFDEWGSDQVPVSFFDEKESRTLCDDLDDILDTLHLTFA